MGTLPGYEVLPLFMLVAAMYASVGHGGASGYLALFAILGIASPDIVPVVLMLNVLVASTGFRQFYREGYFRFDLLLPFILISIPAAFIGGMITIDRVVFSALLGLALLFSAWRILFFRPSPVKPSPPVRARFWKTALPVGAVLGLLAGMIGIGGGVFLSPFLLLIRWADARQTAAISSAFIVVNSLAGLSGHLLRAETTVTFAPLLIAAVLLGGYIGARSGARTLPPRAIRAVLAVVLIMAGSKLIGTAMW